MSTEGLEHNGAVIVSLAPQDGLMHTTSRDDSLCIVHDDPWTEYPTEKPTGLTRYLVESNRGVGVAFWLGSKFQDEKSGDNEGMKGWAEKPYKVYRWMKLPKGKLNS